MKKRNWYGALTLSSLLCMGDLYALQVTQLHSDYHQGEYRLTMTARLAAPLARVQAVLRDYAHYPELDTRILQAEILKGGANNQLELLTRIKVCFAFLCRTLQRVEHVSEHDNGLSAEVVPERSDAEQGSTRTELLAQGAQTQVYYTTSMTPKFWVPPWVGRTWMLRSMEQATVNLFTRIEQRAAAAP